MTISALYRSPDDRRHDTATVLWRNDHRARIFAEFGILSLGPGSRHCVTEVMFTLKRSILNNIKNNVYAFTKSFRDFIHENWRSSSHSPPGCIQRCFYSLNHSLKSPYHWRCVLCGFSADLKLVWWHQLLFETHTNLMWMITAGGKSWIFSKTYFSSIYSANPQFPSLVRLQACLHNLCTLFLAIHTSIKYIYIYTFI